MSYFEKKIEQINIVHDVIESEPSVLNLVETKRPSGRLRKKPINYQNKLRS